MSVWDDIDPSMVVYLLNEDWTIGGLNKRYKIPRGFLEMFLRDNGFVWTGKKWISDREADRQVAGALSRKDPTTARRDYEAAREKLRDDMVKTLTPLLEEIMSALDSNVPSGGEG